MSHGMIRGGSSYRLSSHRPHISHAAAAAHFSNTRTSPAHPHMSVPSYPSSSFLQAHSGGGASASMVTTQGGGGAPRQDAAQILLWSLNSWYKQSRDAGVPGRPGSRRKIHGYKLKTLKVWMFFCISIK